MDQLTNEINRQDLSPGDHIYAYRKLHSYSHHGIFIGGDRVIHYNRTRDGNALRRGRPCKNCGLNQNQLRGVVNSCVDCFLKGHTLRRFRYGVRYSRFLTNWPGTCTTGRADVPDVTIGRAYDLLNNGFGDYNLFENNCEAFAVYCKTGRRVSDQAGLAASLINAGVEVAMNRLRRDVWVHHGEQQHNELNQMINIGLANMSSLQQVIAYLDHQGR